MSARDLLPLVVIQGVELVPIEYAGQRVLTLAMMDHVHQRPEGTARRNFNENKNRLIEGDDYFVRNSSEARQLGVTAPNGLTLLTETGYSMLVKSFTDDLAWDVQRQLVKSYFAQPAAARDEDRLAGLPPEQRALVAVMLSQAEMKAQLDTQAAAIATVQQRVEEIADGQVFTACPSNAEPITVIRARINKKYGLPAWVIDEVMAQMPYSLKPAGTALNGHELAQGAKYSIYWVRDVSRVFSRFAGECTRTTPHRAKHPFVDSEFKLAPGFGQEDD